MLKNGRIFLGLLLCMQPLFSLENIGVVADWPLGFPKNPQQLAKPYEELTFSEKLSYRFFEKGCWLEEFSPRKNFRKIVVHNDSCHEKTIFHCLKGQLILFLWEPCVVKPRLYKRKYLKHFSKIFTFDDDLVDGKTYFKFFYPCMWKMTQDRPQFKDKKFCALFGTHLTSTVPGELYSERRRAIKFFEEQPSGIFDLYGRHWEKKGYKNYKGPVPDKITVLKNYKFNICYENTSTQNGYITEKIFDAFQAGVVPIYLGAPNITSYIPKECFIDKRNFPTYEALYAFLQTITEEEYEEYISHIQQFLESDTAKLFTQENFIETFCNGLL